MRLQKGKFLLLSLLALSLAGCSLDDNSPASKDKLAFHLPQGTEELAFYPGETKTIKLEAKGISDIALEAVPEGWQGSYDAKAKSLTITAPAVTHDPFTLQVTGVNDMGSLYRATVPTKSELALSGDCLVLSEGSMGRTNGSLSYVGPGLNTVAPKIFSAVNGTNGIGFVTQDLTIHKGKIYFISQGSWNGDPTASLVVADAKSLRIVGDYTDAVKDLKMPSHIAALDDETLILRDNQGGWLLNTKTSELKPIKESAGMRKNSIAVVSGKAFFSIGKELCIVTKESGDTIAKRIPFEDTVSGVVRAGADKVYVSSSDGMVATVDAKTLEVIDTKDLQTENLKASFLAIPSFSAKGDTIYTARNMEITRHILSTGESKEMWGINDAKPDYTVMYQGPVVDPESGLVVVAGLKDWASYTTNTLFVLDLKGDEAKVVRELNDFMEFPAGFFFPANFE